MRRGQLGVGIAIVVVGGFLALSPHLVAEVLGLPAVTSTQLINLRASWGGTVMGVGAFVAWFPGLRPRPVVVLGLLGWAMTGIGVARLVGFALDGSPDARQLVWITAEVVLAIGSAFGISRLRRRDR